MYGGEVKSTMRLVGDNVLEVEGEGSELLGRRKWTERFTEEGMWLEMGSEEKGNHWKELWARK